MHSILEEIEALDLRIVAAAEEDVESLAAWVEQRGRASDLLLESMRDAGESELARVATLLANTAQIKRQITSQRDQAAEDLDLLERQDQLLHLLQPVTVRPCYMDISA